MYEIIFSETELKYFYENILPPLKPAETHFVSLSARNKLLNKSIQEGIHLGRSEMFNRKIITENSWPMFLRTIRSFEVNTGAYKTKSNHDIPSDCMVCYININPSNTLKVYNDFSNTMNNLMFELSQCAVNKLDSSNVIGRINKMYHTMMTCYQRNRGTKHYIDIDFDIPKEKFFIVRNFSQYLKENGIEYFIVETHGGYHVLLKRDTIKMNFTQEIKNLNQVFPEYEIIVNKNEMIPLPGTLHGGFKVRVIDDGE
jgi:hypothetical protein